MTQDEIIEMARQAWADSGEGWVVKDWFDDRAKAFEAFAKLVAAKEREAFKAVCEKSRYAKQDEWRVTRSMIVSEIIEAIDARGEA